MLIHQIAGIVAVSCGVSCGAFVVVLAMYKEVVKIREKLALMMLKEEVKKHG